MKYKEFVAWCNKRACDGYWSPDTIMYCIAVMDEVNSAPIWKRKKVWNTHKDYVTNKIVNVINKKIEEYLKGESEE